jgi:membrane protease YdiL (CAAX protease family)
MQILKLVITIVIFFVLHRWIGKYPTPLPLSKDRKREILETIALWVFSVVVASMFMVSRTPGELAAPSNELWGLISLIQLVPFIVGPLLFVLLVNKWTAKDLGFSMPSARSVTIFAIAVFSFLGIIPIFLGQKPIPVSDLLWALYVTAFVEEFFFRAIIQGKLERALGQNKAWFYGGILFGLAHVVTNFFVRGLDIVPGIFELVAQIIAGWIFGIIYMKTRSLLPSFVAHYVQDFRLGSIIARLFF